MSMPDETYTSDYHRETPVGSKPAVVPLKQQPANTPLSYIAGSIQKLVYKDLMALSRGLEGDFDTDVGRAESLLAWAEKYEAKLDP